jgi:hypothetical protein
MFPRRIVPAMIAAVLILAAGTTPAAAAKPTRGAQPAERPLTAEEQAASDRKIAAAIAYLASPAARAAERATLDCVTPNGAVPSTTAGTMQGCEVPGGFLSVSARDQAKGHWCGPAVGQVIANYTWAVPLDDNKYSQRKIAGWMRTDENGGTDAHAMEDGLELATAGAPRRPDGWDWVVTYLRDTDGDGTVADQWFDYVRSNVSGSKMPLAVPVLPHDADGRFHLESWPVPVESIGHWIAGYGWSRVYDGTNASQMLYTDSSEDEGGSTGLFADPMRFIAGMIRDHTGRFVW